MSEIEEAYHQIRRTLEGSVSARMHQVEEAYHNIRETMEAWDGTNERS